MSDEAWAKAHRAMSEKIVALECHLSATRAELAEVRAALEDEAAWHEAEGDWQAERHHSRAAEIRAALAPVTESASEGGENE